MLLLFCLLVSRWQNACWEMVSLEWIQRVEVKSFSFYAYKNSSRCFAHAMIKEGRITNYLRNDDGCYLLPAFAFTWDDGLQAYEESWALNFVVVLLNKTGHAFYSNILKIQKGPTGSRTQVAGFKVQSANHYTMEPSLFACFMTFLFYCIKSWIVSFMVSVRDKNFSL